VEADDDDDEALIGRIERSRRGQTEEIRFDLSMRLQWKRTGLSPERK